MKQLFGHTNIDILAEEKKDYKLLLDSERSRMHVYYKDKLVHTEEFEDMVENSLAEPETDQKSVQRWAQMFERTEKMLSNFINS